MLSSQKITEQINLNQHLKLNVYAKFIHGFSPNTGNGHISPLLSSHEWGRSWIFLWMKTGISSVVHGVIVIIIY